MNREENPKMNHKYLRSFDKEQKSVIDFHVPDFH